MRRAYLFLLITATLCGCGPQHDPRPTSGSGSGTSGKKLRIAVIPKGTSHQFWKSVHAGAQQAAKELGNVEVVWQGPARESDTQQQIEIVQGMVVQRVDGIVLAPNHSESLLESVQEANAKKIPVVIFDSGLKEGAELVSYVATDNEKGGELAAQRLAEVLGDKGNVILLRYRAGSESTEMREEGFLKEMAKHPDIKVLSSNQYAEDTSITAKAKAEQLLLQFKDEVDGMFAVCEPNAEGTLQALENLGYAGKVKFIAFDRSDDLIAGLKEDKVHGIVLQDPERMGYLSVKALVDHIQSKPVETRIPTGEYVATKENMDSDEIKKLLHPKQEE
jgi:ribose transport system substrate-binding protein